MKSLTASMKLTLVASYDKIAPASRRRTPISATPSMPPQRSAARRASRVRYLKDPRPAELGADPGREEHGFGRTLDVMPAAATS